MNAEKYLKEWMKSKVDGTILNDQQIIQIMESYSKSSPISKESIPSDDAIKNFIGKAVYEQMGQRIWAVDSQDGHQMFLELRGWGAIQHLFKTEKEAENFQDKLGEWVAETINNRLSMTTTSESEWISVEDRTPDDDYELKIRIKYKDGTTDESTGGDLLDDRFDEKVITHWQPLPKPPEVKQ